MGENNQRVLKVMIGFVCLTLMLTGVYFVAQSTEWGVLGAYESFSGYDKKGISISEIKEKVISSKTLTYKVLGVLMFSLGSLGSLLIVNTLLKHQK